MRRFQSKSQNFHTPCIFAVAEGVPIGIEYRRRGQKNYNDWATGPTKKFDDIFSHLDRMHERDRQTDIHKDRYYA